MEPSIGYRRPSTSRSSINDSQARNSVTRTSVSSDEGFPSLDRPAARERTGTLERLEAVHNAETHRLRSLALVSAQESLAPTDELIRMSVREPKRALPLLLGKLQHFRETYETLIARRWKMGQDERDIASIWTEKTLIEHRLIQTGQQVPSWHLPFYLEIDCPRPGYPRLDPDPEPGI